MSVNNEGEGQNPNPVDNSELSEKIAKLQTEKENLVDELKNDRSKYREQHESLTKQITDLQNLLQQSVTKNNANPEEVKIEEVVKKVLSNDAATRAKKNFSSALEKFVKDNKEYSEENDTTGLKRKALQEKLNLFNISGIQEAEDFMSVIGDAHRLLVRSDHGQTISGTMPHSDPQPSTVPAVTPEKKLSDKEMSLIKNNNWSEEKYLELKKKMPEYFESLLSKNY